MMETLKIRYLKEKIRGLPDREEIYYLLDGIPRRIELSPGPYRVNSCTVQEIKNDRLARYIQDVEAPSDLLESIIADIERDGKQDKIFDENHDATVQPRLEKNIRKFRIIVGKQLGYPYAKYRPKKVMQE